MNKIWAWKRTDTGGWWALNRSASPASSEAIPYYQIPDEMIEQMRCEIENDVGVPLTAEFAHDTLRDLLAIIGDQ